MKIELPQGPPKISPFHLSADPEAFKVRVKKAGFSSCTTFYQVIPLYQIREKKKIQKKEQRERGQKDQKEEGCKRRCKAKKLDQSLL